MTRYRPRLLPLLVGAAGLLLCTKLMDLWLAIDLGAGPAKAETSAAVPPAQAGGTPSGADGAGKQPPQRDPTLYSSQEIELLQSLAKRRSELDQRSGEIDQREALLQAAEQRINQKIAKLQEMQGSIDESFKKEDQQDDEKIKSLVKIYETMKPKEAARIFEQLDLPVLLDVVEKMKERNTAPILASMDPLKAKTLTLALAARHPSPEPKP